MTTTTYQISGLTCDHCASAIRDEVSALDGVDGVSVELVPHGISHLTLDTDAPVSVDVLGAALAEAGDYVLVAPAQ